MVMSLWPRFFGPPCIIFSDLFTPGLHYISRRLELLAVRSCVEGGWSCVRQHCVESDEGGRDARSSSSSSSSSTSSTASRHCCWCPVTARGACCCNTCTTRSSVAYQCNDQRRNPGQPVNVPTSVTPLVVITQHPIREPSIVMSHWRSQDF